MASSSESEFWDDVVGLRFLESDFASDMIPSSADLGKGGPEFLSGGWILGLERGEGAFNLRMRSVVANFLISSSRFIVRSFASFRSEGVGMGGPLPPVGSGVSTQAPVIKGVLRLMWEMEGLGLSGPGVLSSLSIQAPVTMGVLRSTTDLDICGVFSPFSSTSGSDRRQSDFSSSLTLFVLSVHWVLSFLLFGTACGLLSSLAGLGLALDALARFLSRS